MLTEQEIIDMQGDNALYELPFARRWSRAWKEKAKWLAADARLGQKYWRKDIARIAELEDALRKVRPLLQDTVDAHRDPSDADYNECDTDPCAWCAEAKELVEKPDE